MKEFWALVSFEYRKILGKRSVKIALLLTLFLCSLPALPWTCLIAMPFP